MKETKKVVIVFYYYYYIIFAKQKHQQQKIQILFVSMLFKQTNYRDVSTKGRQLFKID